jgi:hypothetical protein
MTEDLTGLEETGPIDYLVVAFPDAHLNGEAFPLLVDLVDRGIIRILDLVFIQKAEDGSVSALELEQLKDGGIDLSIFEGASSGLIGDDDISEAANALEPGDAAGVIIYENVWAAPFAVALRRAGGQLVASGRIPVQAIIAALDAAEAVG